MPHSPFHACVGCVGQGPLSRFGDTAANAGALALLEDVDVNVGVKTACASLSAGLFRIFLMPVDTIKTSLQARHPLLPPLSHPYKWWWCVNVCVRACVCMHV